MLTSSEPHRRVDCPPCLNGLRFYLLFTVANKMCFVFYSGLTAFPDSPGGASVPSPSLGGPTMGPGGTSLGGGFNVSGAAI